MRDTQAKPLRVIADARKAVGYSPELERAARAAGYKSAEEMVLFEEARERRNTNRAVVGKTKPAKPAGAGVAPAKKPPPKMGVLDAISEALTRHTRK